MNIYTVGQLRRMLDKYEDNTPVGSGIGEGIVVEECFDTMTMGLLFSDMDEESGA